MFRRGFKSWAEKRALEFRNALTVLPTGYLSAKSLANYLGIPVLGPADLYAFGLKPASLDELLVTNQTCWSAVTVPIETSNVIIHNTSHLPERQESNLMHEMAHIICGHEPGKIHCAGRFPWALRTYDEDQEDEANWLGACLQIPRSGLLWAIRLRMTNDAIAKHFRASEAIVRFRRNTAILILREGSAGGRGRQMQLKIRGEGRKGMEG